jgi:hypothetical protein
MLLTPMRAAWLTRLSLCLLQLANSGNAEGLQALVSAHA